MGRKPNQLILEFFTRGPKLDDQSNRYQHTCKKCGMFFPKGRPDSMNRHLFEKCPEISDLDKARAYTYAQGQLDPQAIAKRFGDSPGLQQFTGPIDYEALARLQAQESQSAQIPTLDREPSALDTLAEVSRQHMDLTRQRSEIEGLVAQNAQTIPSADMNETDWMLHLQQQLSQANHQEDFRNSRQASEQGNSDGAEELVEAASAASNINAALQQGDAPPTTSFPNGHDHSESFQIDDSSALDPALQAHPQVPTPKPSGTKRASSNTTSYTPDLNALQTWPDAGTHGFGLLNRPLKKQKRNKFSAERRKEVGGLRKIGACLRCKMLKKPCSGETPCSTCRAVHTPRLWRASCIRTRIAEEFTLYNTSYFYARAREAVTAHVGADKPHQLKAQIRVSPVVDATSFMRLPALGIAHVGAGNAFVDVNKTNFVAELEVESPLDSVEELLRNMQDRCIGSETSRFLQVSLRTLSSLTPEGGDPLIERTLLLWIATKLLIDTNLQSWSFHFIPHEGAADDGMQLISPTHPSAQVIRSQVLYLIERLAGQLVKHVCNELERRLLARSTTSPLTTFLVTVILLNCTERMSHLFRTFDPRSITSSDDPEDDTAPNPANWPLNRPPRSYYAQAPNFAQILTLLLRMRKLPPDTAIRHDDSLAVLLEVGNGKDEVDPEANETDPVNALGQKPDDKHAHAIATARWLRGTGVTASRLSDAARKTDDDGAWINAGDAQDSPVVVGVGEKDEPIVVHETAEKRTDYRAWDLRFVAWLLLPGGA